jgi:hypothetical protein
VHSGPAKIDTIAITRNEGSAKPYQSATTRGKGDLQRLQDEIPLAWMTKIARIQQKLAGLKIPFQTVTLAVGVL